MHKSRFQYRYPAEDKFLCNYGDCDVWVERKMKFWVATTAGTFDTVYFNKVHTREDFLAHLDRYLTYKDMRQALIFAWDFLKDDDPSVSPNARKIASGQEEIPF